MKFSLKRKSVLLIIIVMVLVGIATLLCFYRSINTIIRDQYHQQSVSLSRSVALNVNPDNTQAVRDAVMEIYNSIPADQRLSIDHAGSPGYDEYKEKFSRITKMVEYQMLLTQIQKILEETEAHDVSIGWADKESGAYIYLTDATTNPDFFITPGTFKHISEHNTKTLDAPGLGFEPQIIDGDGIQLISSAMPIYDKNFHVTGFAEIDINMETAIRQMNSYMRIMGGLLVLILVITTIVLINLVDRSIVRPINMLADASACYCSNDSAGDRSKRKIRFSDLSIRTRDEIEGLANSMAQMERDLDDYIASLTETRVQLSTTTEYAKKMDRIAYIDALTGVRNKRSYGDAMDELAKDISGGIAKFGIAVVDLNYLKMYNDTYGHEKGDIAIRTICNMICETFKHSPVFRYGGDEFAIILEGHDLRFIDGLIAELKRKTEETKADPELEPWQKVSAAIGYAVFDPDIDSDPDSVFKRADNEMYKDKKAMKAAAAL